MWDTHKKAKADLPLPRQSIKALFCVTNLMMIVIVLPRPTEENHDDVVEEFVLGFIPVKWSF